MSILFKQMNCVHQLALPTDIIRVIKGYAFVNRIIYKSEKIKNNILQLIKETYYSGVNFQRIAENGEQYFIMEDCYLFWINEDDKCPQFQSIFCNSCGNYKSLHEHMSEQSCCLCL